MTSTMQETRQNDNDTNDTNSTNNTNMINYGLIYTPIEYLSTDPKQRVSQLFNCRSTKCTLINPNTNTTSTSTNTNATNTNTGGTAAHFLYNELECYFDDMVGGTGQPKSAVELLLLHATLLDGIYYEK